MALERYKVVLGQDWTKANSRFDAVFRVRRNSDSDDNSAGDDSQTQSMVEGIVLYSGQELDLES
jgi:hypothetical protein